MTELTNSRLLDSLPEEYRTNENVTKYLNKETGDLDLLQLAKAHDHLSRATGWPADQVLRIPKADDAAGWEGLYSRLGRPDTPEAYAFNGIDLAQGGDKAFVEGFRADAHRLGFTQAQMDGTMAYLGSSIAIADQQLATQIDTDRKAARADFNAWAGSPEKIAIYENEIPSVVERLGLKAGLVTKNEDGTVNADSKANLIKVLNVGGEADNPALLRLFAVMADMTAEPGALPGTGHAVTPQAGGMDKASATSALAAFNADGDKLAALYDPRHASHRSVKAEWQELIKASTRTEGS